MKIDSLKNLLLSIDDFFLSHFKAIPLHKILDAHSASLIEFANNQEDSCWYSKANLLPSWKIELW